jgi:hypothetical protein
MRLILAVLATLLFAGCAEAATCTWQGGTAAWNNSNTASWSCGHVPVAADSVVFDGTSGGGTVTVAATINGVSNTINTLTWGAFTGTIDFATNSVALIVTGTPCFSGSGTGARKVLTAGAQFTCTLATSAPSLVTMSTVTNLDGTSDFTGTWVFPSGNPFVRGFLAGTSLHWGTLTIASNSSSGLVNITGTTAITFDTINFAGPGALSFPNTITTTITNAFSWVGSSYAAPSLIEAAQSPGIIGTIHASAASTMDKVAVRDLTFNTSSVTVTGYDLGNNTFSGGGGITAPATSSAHSLIIGGP